MDEECKRCMNFHKPCKDEKEILITEKGHCYYFKDRLSEHRDLLRHFKTPKPQNPIIVMMENKMKNKIKEINISFEK